MVTFAELVETVEHLSKEETQEIKKIIERKWLNIRQQELIQAVEEARKESVEGKTLVLFSPEEIKSYFEKIMRDAD